MLPVIAAAAAGAATGGLTGYLSKKRMQHKKWARERPMRQAKALLKRQTAHAKKMQNQQHASKGTFSHFHHFSYKVTFSMVMMKMGRLYGAVKRRHKGQIAVAPKRGSKNIDISKAIPMPRPMPGGGPIPPKRPSLKKKGGVAARGLGGMAKQFALDAAKSTAKKAGNHVKGLAKEALKNQGKKILHSMTGIKMG